MNRDPITSLARILSPDGQRTVGTAFFFGEAHRLMTCAHVAILAGARPGETLKLVCHKDPEHTYQAKVLQEGWRESAEEDVAVLQLVADEHPLSGNVHGVAIGSSFNVLGKTLNTFGFSSLMQKDGLNGKCEVIGKTTTGGVEVLQIRSNEVSLGFSGAPAWDPNTGLVLGMVVSIISPKREAAGRQSETAFVTPIEVIRRVYPDLTIEGACPYRGLEPFEEQHKEIYFGREKQIEEMMQCLLRSDLVAIVGVSGSGKSSLARAGLAKGLDKYGEHPSLARRARVISKTGATPLFNLIDAMNSLENNRIVELLDLPLSLFNNQKAEAREVLRDKAPAEIAAKLRESCIGNPVLLVVDQFEQLFTECPDQKARARFAEILLGAAGDEIKILLTLRVDFYKDVVEQTVLGHSLNAAQVLLQQMDEAELISAIQKPAQSVGRELESDLINKLIEDVRGRPTDLPLLEFALKELWDLDSEKGVLTTASYEKLGFESPEGRISGVRGVIIKRAEDEWTKQKEKGQERLAETILLSLVTAAQPSQNETANLDTSRRARLAEFDRDTRKVAQDLADSFLLTTSVDPFTRQPTIEVSHEALIRNWPRLQLLVREHRLFVAWYVQEFIPYFQGWLAEDDPRIRKKLLLPDVMLFEAQLWRRQYPTLMVGPRAEYIDDSASRRKRRRVFQGLIIAAMIFAAVAITFTVQSANKSQGDELHERGVQALMANDYQQAQLLLAESLQFSDSDEAREHLLDARINGARALATQQSEGIILAASLDGRWYAIRGKDKIIKVWDRLTGKEKATTFLMEEADPKTARIALSSTGNLLAFGDPNQGTVQLWDFTANRKVAPEPMPSKDAAQQISGIDSLAISPDETLIAYGNMSGVIHIWDKTANLPLTVSAHDGAVHCLSFSPSGKRLVSAGADYTVSVMDLRERPLKSTALGFHDDFITSVTFNDAETQVASGSADASIRVWDLEEKSEKVNVPNSASNESSDGKKREPYLLTGHVGAVTSVRFNPEGTMILSGSEDQTVRVWDTTIRKEILKLGTYTDSKEGGVEAALFSAGGFQIISASRNGAIRLWEISKRPEGVTVYDSKPVAAVVFYPDSKKLAFGDTDGNIFACDLNSQRTELLGTVPSGVNSLAFGPDGLLAAGGGKGAVQLLDTRSTSAQVKTALELPGPVWGLAFQPKGEYLAVGGGNTRKGYSDIRLWNIHSGVSRTLYHDHVSVWTIAFSSDGNYLASGGGDKKIRIWDMRTFQRIVTFDPKEGDELWGVPFGFGDRTIASAGLDRQVKIWSLQDLLTRSDAEPLQTFSQHEGIIQSATFSPSGEWIASASLDHTVGLSNVKTRKSIKLDLHVRPVWWVAFSPDEKLLASGGIDKRVRISSLASINHVLTASPQELLEEAKHDTCLDSYKPPLVRRLLTPGSGGFWSAIQDEGQIRFGNCSH